MPFDGTVISEAAEAIILLDRMQSYFQSSRYWTRGQMRQGKRRCILGALEDAATALRIHSGPTVYYLLCALDPHWKSLRDMELPWSRLIMEFNDHTARNHRDIRRLLSLARYYAERDGSR
jgi:hypothetical protein